jgi:hypothetical protein
MPVTDEQRERFVTTFIPKPEAEVIHAGRLVTEQSGLTHHGS